MIPNVFISSTIADLHYLREGMRDAVSELRYRPVMSEFGEVGYLNPMTAAESCYRSIPQCQLVVVIIGKRYGSISTNGRSITHNEFLAARQDQIPTIALVERQVLSFKEVYDADRDAAIWNTFRQMDNAAKTFEFLEEIAASPMYNAIVPFDSVGDAKRKLKLQIANFVGDRLNETIRPMAQQLHDVLAEIKTLRKQLGSSATAATGSESDIRRYLAVTRLLLNDNMAQYRKFLEHLFGELDAAVEAISTIQTLEAVFEKANYTYEVIPDEEIKFGFEPERHRPSPGQECLFVQVGMKGGYEVYADKRVKISTTYFSDFDSLQRSIYSKLKFV